MTSFVLRRSALSLSGLVALLVGVGFAAVGYLGLPLWFPVAFAVALTGVQYVVNPWIIQWLVPAAIVGGPGMPSDHPVVALVERRCADAGVPMVRLGIVDDGTPNAFAFGRTTRDARIWLTRGLIERLDERELDAVVAHEIGHVKHRDFIVMTLAAVIPMTLYLVYLVTRRGDRRGAAVAAAAYAGYVVSQFLLLALGRARETAADHWSCECTADGDALASALVKVAYGMGVAHAEVKASVAALTAGSKQQKKQAAKAQRRYDRAQSMRAMGIFEPRAAAAMAAAFAGGVDPERAVHAMRWDLTNPWAGLLEKMSSHPLVAHRIAALERSGLPGAPRTWGVLRAAAAADPEMVTRARLRFGREVAVMVAPYVMLVAVALGAFTDSGITLGIALTISGALLVYKQTVRYPGGFEPVDGITSLLERLDASPMTGIPVEIRGRIIGRGTPGYVLSPDLVISDETGFVPLTYRQPLPFVAALFGLFRAEGFLGEVAVARGWYRRAPGPYVELRSVRAGYGGRARTWWWAAAYAVSWLVVVAGVVVLAASAVSG
jgi:Zn-dependent protease with chaperone function